MNDINGDIIIGETTNFDSWHGVFVKLFGCGVLLIGISGVGKSETALELVIRGHALIADDLVEVIAVEGNNEKELIGRAPENLRNYLESRGVGVINVPQLYGTRSVQKSSKIDLLIELMDEAHSENMEIEKEVIKIMGIEIEKYRVVVSSGRSCANVVETIVMSYIKEN